MRQPSVDRGSVSEVPARSPESPFALARVCATTKRCKNSRRIQRASVASSR